MQSKNLFSTALGVAVSVGVVFGMVWVASRAWKSGQK